MDTVDPQHQAVRDAAAQLKDHRYWTREPAAQDEYLQDLGDLAREVAFVLDQAGITWDQLGAALEDVGGLSATLLAQARENGGGHGVTELAFGHAIEAARSTTAER